MWQEKKVDGNHLTSHCHTNGVNSLLRTVSNSLNTFVFRLNSSRVFFLYFTVELVLSFELWCNPLLIADLYHNMLLFTFLLSSHFHVCVYVYEWVWVCVRVCLYVFYYWLIQGLLLHDEQDRMRLFKNKQRIVCLMVLVNGMSYHHSHPIFSVLVHHTERRSEQHSWFYMKAENNI